jgi:hypothetical protein
MKEHKITLEHRARMIDWMIEVLSTFKCSDKTFFLSVNIMDRYFKCKQRELFNDDLHMIGIVSMFIASKYEDVLPLLMKTVVSKIGHNKFPLKDIELCEIEILKKLSFKVGIPTIKDHIDMLLYEHKKEIE